MVLDILVSCYLDCSVTAMLVPEAAATLSR